MQNLRRRLNIFVNLAVFLAFLVLLTSRAVLALVSPGGSALQQWTALQQSAGMAFTLLVAVHIILHWKWFWNQLMMIRK